MAQAGLGIVELESASADRLARFLAEHGLGAEVLDMAATMGRLRTRPPRLLILGDRGETAFALSLLRRIREVSRIPCAVLGSSADEVSQVLILEAGADDLVPRGLPLRALLARLRAVLRRAEWGVAEPMPALPINGWHLFPQRRQLLRPDGSECQLTTAEFDLMQMLVEAHGRAVSRDAIAATVFRRPFRAEDRTVDNLVLRLRRKLGPEQEEAIKTIRGAGYMFAGFREVDRRVA
jgi:DNA-binding response OmpR family regulator